MYLLQFCNVRKIAQTEAKRDALIALGYTEVKQSEKETAPSGVTEQIPEGPAGNSEQTKAPRKKAKAE